MFDTDPWIVTQRPDSALPMMQRLLTSAANDLAREPADDIEIDTDSL